jgi:hypothetical protein
MTKHSSAYEQISRFIHHHMRMWHVYQPVMLREVLRHEVAASVKETKALLAENHFADKYSGKLGADTPLTNFWIFSALVCVDAFADAMASRSVSIALII